MNRRTSAVTCLLSLSLSLGCDDDDSAAKREAAASPSPPAASAVASAAAPEAPPPKPKPRGPEEPLNVIVLTIDSLRADMPWTGYERDIAPFLTELAKKSVVYTNAYSVSSYTAKSVSAMFTSRWPSMLYRSGYFFETFADSNVFFTELLQDANVRTMSWHGHMYFGRGKGLAQGFDEWHLVPGISFNSETDEHITSEKMTELGIKLFSDPKNTDGQFFAWAHYMDPHDQYIKHEMAPDFGDFNRDRYDSEVYFTDHWVKKLVDFAKKQPWWERTALIISADHGEAFGEHGMYKHAFELWEVLTHVPLIVYAPGIEPQRIEERRSLIDLAPTIMDLMKKPKIDSFLGKTMVPEIYGAEEPDNREPILLELPEDTHNPYRRAIISGDYKLIVHGRNAHKYLLFNLAKDPGEETELSEKEPEKLAEMQKKFEAVYEKIPRIEPYGGGTLKSGRTARGPMQPADAGTGK